MSLNTNSTTGESKGSDDRRAPLEANGMVGESPSGEGRGDESRGGESRGGDDMESGFPPPDEPIMVFCMHCGKEYMSSEMVPPDGTRSPIMMDRMWWCGTPGCSAGGFGLDVFPVDPEWKDPKGLLHIITDSDEEEEFEWDEDDEEE